MKFTKFEVSQKSFTKIKKMYNNYVFNRAEKGKFFVNLSPKQVRECKAKKLIS